MTPARHNNNENRSNRYNTWLPDLFNSFFDEPWTPVFRSHTTSPSINVIETDDKYILELAAPGMTKEDFSVKLNDNGDLVIDMEKKDEAAENHDEEGKEQKKEQSHYLRREFSYSRFQQTMLLPDDALRDNITAKVENGILTVDIPKVEKVAKENRNRAITIG